MSTQKALLEQYSLLINIQCLDDFFYEQLPMQSVPAKVTEQESLSSEVYNTF